MHTTGSEYSKEPIKDNNLITPNWLRGTILTQEKGTGGTKTGEQSMQTIWKKTCRELYRRTILTTDQAQEMTDEEIEDTMGEETTLDLCACVSE